MSVEERVQGALEEVQDRLKQLEKTTHELATSPGEEPSMNTLKPIVMSRRVSIILDQGSDKTMCTIKA